MNADKLIAHRGWQQRYPENTRIAIEQAIAVGAKNIEIDIQLSADHKPVLCHDSNLLRLSGHSISINECTLQQLSEYSAYEPERLGDTFIGTPFCSLEQCLQVIASHPQTTLYIEIKSESINHYGRQCVLDSLLPLIFPHQQQCVLISFDFTILEQAVSAGWLRTGPVLSQWQQRAGLPAGEAGIEIIFCDYNDLPSELTSDDLAYPIAVYEVGNKELASQLLKRGISMIETFAIGDLISCAT